MSNDSNCGCGPSVPQPGNQVIVPPGTHIVQTPCPAVSPQSVIVPANALNAGGAGASPQDCVGFGMPVVAKTFVSAGTNRTGSFFANCAGVWGLPGMMAYFPSQGQIEILGVNQNTVTYRNRTMHPGVEILEGTRFAVGIPMAPMEVVDDGDDSGAPTGDTYENSAQLSNIRGVFNGVPSRISPVNNNVLVGRGNAWQRRQLGQMRYPASGQLLNISRSAANVQYTVNLPSKPVLPEEVSGLAIELNINLSVSRNGSGAALGVRMLVENYFAIRAASDGPTDQNTTNMIVGVAKEKTSITIKLEKTTSPTGDMAAAVTLAAYYY